MSLETLKTKVGLLIEKAKNSSVIDMELVSIIQDGINNAVANPNCVVFRGWQLPESYIHLFDFSTVKQFISTFYANKAVKNLSINTSSAEVINQMCSACTELETIVLSDTSKVKTWISPFNVCRKLKSIKTLDFSSVTTATNPFLGCDVVEELLFVPETIKVSISIPSAVLSAESKDSIFNGLATVTTAQTLTLNSNAKILQSQVDSANAKGWTVAGGTVVGEEEYYG